MEVFPSPNGSQAKPSLGAKFLYRSGPILSPYGEFLPPMMKPFRGSPVFATRLPLESTCGALEGSYLDGSKVFKKPLASVACRNNDQRTPRLMVRLRRTRMASSAKNSA